MAATHTFPDDYIDGSTFPGHKTRYGVCGFLASIAL
jgi:hypothetical protein